MHLIQEAGINGELAVIIRIKIITEIKNKFINKCLRCKLFFIPEWYRICFTTCNYYNLLYCRYKLFSIRFKDMLNELGKV